jgi:hypothetical protein
MTKPLTQASARPSVATLALALLVGALTLRCGGTEASGSGGNGNDESGCSGTTGELGLVKLVPQEDPWADVAASHGRKAFAVGTTEPFDLATADPEIPLPLLVPASRSPGVFTVQATPRSPGGSRSTPRAPRSCSSCARPTAPSTTTSRWR